MQRFIFLAICFLLINILTAYAGDKITKNDSNYGYKRLNLGEVPWDDPKKIAKWYKPIITYISEYIEIEIVLNISPDYRTLEQDLANNNIHIASLNSGTYAETLQTMPDKINYLCTVEWDGTCFKKSFIFTKKESHISNIKDMQAKTIGFTDKASSSGYKYPIYIFLEKGIDPSAYFSKIFFLGDHNKVVNAVFNGFVDIGATYDIKYKAFQSKNNSPFKIISESPEEPFAAMVTSSSLPEELFLKIKDAFLSVNAKSTLKDGTLVLGGDYPLSGFQIKDNSIYKRIIDINQTVFEYEKKKQTSKIDK
ncbi:MAG: phosphate/phosphite/phosphonate ABC transporter substrate-binding protein [Desulfobacterales bacterium]|nr:phosphate/phosphite/phosphonate ABC transporter substrate-binding protein [Desulfobacterales bacterium]